MQSAIEKPAGRILCATFQVGGLLMGIDVQHVQEVLRAQATTRVPRAPAAVQGLINLRGQIVTAIDMRRRLGLPGGDGSPADRAGDFAASAGASPPMNVVIRTADGPLSLLVDEIGEVIEVYSGQYEDVPANLDARQTELLQGVYKLDADLLLLLEPERLAVLPAPADGVVENGATAPGVANRRREG